MSPLAAIDAASAGLSSSCLSLLIASEGEEYVTTSWSGSNKEAKLIFESVIKHAFIPVASYRRMLFAYGPAMSMCRLSVI